MVGGEWNGMFEWMDGIVMGNDNLIHGESRGSWMGKGEKGERIDRVFLSWCILWMSLAGRRWAFFGWGSGSE